MQPHCITELRLKLKVACADRTTKDMFKKTRENLDKDTKVCFPFNSFSQHEYCIVEVKQFRPFADCSLITHLMLTLILATF